MNWYSEDFIRAIPKTDLHVHLDGSLRIPTLIELARERNVELPSYDESSLLETVFKEKYADLNDYLQGFAYTTAVMTDPEALERIAYELAEDNILEGVRYLEVRFAPQLHIRQGLTFEDILEAVDRGLRKKRDEFNRVIGDDEPMFEYGIIVCAMRFFNEHFSPYYADFIRMHRFFIGDRNHQVCQPGAGQGGGAAEGSERYPNRRFRPCGKRVRLSGFGSRKQLPVRT
jgi:adenosine deaminase